MTSTKTNPKQTKSALTKKATAFAVIAVLTVSIFAGNLMTLQAMADTGNGTVHSAASDKQAVRQALRQALELDKDTFHQAVQSADLAFHQAVQTAQLAHKQAIQDANTAFKTAEQNARDAYKTATSGAHGNPTIIGPAMATRDQAIATAQTTKVNAIVSADVTFSKAEKDAWAAHETSVYGAQATKDGNDGTAQSTFYTAIGNATLATRATTIGQAHVTEDNAILKARSDRITAVETADAAKIQAVGAAQTTFISSEIALKGPLDNGYTSNGKTWNAALQSYWNAVAPLEQTRDSAIAAANANQASAVGSADGARDQAIDQTHAAMYGTISAAYS